MVVFQSQPGSSRHRNDFGFTNPFVCLWAFQSRTGSPGHLAVLIRDWSPVRGYWVSSVMTLGVREEHENGLE